MIKMFLLVPAVLLTCTGVSSYQQQLVCPYSPAQKGLSRVWCKRDADNHNCCTGFAFQPETVDLDAGSLTVQDNGKAFVVSINSLSQGDGVYWCGLRNDTLNGIVKLAESQLYSSPANFIWEILRWVVFLLLLVAVISTSVYSNRKSQKEKKTEGVYESVLEEKQR